MIIENFPLSLYSKVLILSKPKLKCWQITQYQIIGGKLRHLRKHLRNDAKIAMLESLALGDIRIKGPLY